MKQSAYSHNNSTTGRTMPHPDSLVTAPPPGELPVWTDERLVEALKMRDSAAVQFAVETYAPRLYRYALYQLGDEMAAEDLVSEVVTRMLEKIDSYKYSGAPFQAWLFSIARNLVTDIYRRKGKMNTVSLDTAGSDEGSEGYSASPQLGELDASLEALPGNDAVAHLMAQLTPEQRQVLTLRIVEGWEPAEIARLLGRSIDSVKSLQYRGLQLMRRYLERDSYPEHLSKMDKREDRVE